MLYCEDASFLPEIVKIPLLPANRVLVAIHRCLFYFTTYLFVAAFTFICIPKFYWFTDGTEYFCEVVYCIENLFRVYRNASSTRRTFPRFPVWFLLKYIDRQ